MTGMDRWTCTLATGATGTALCLSVLAGWQRGGSVEERLVWVVLGIVLVASAHLLPAVIREAPFVMRAVGAVLWFASVATVCHGHATFFLLAQRHAGEMRSASVPVNAFASAGHSLTAVMGERADVAARLATLNAQHCRGPCTTLEARRVTLGTKLNALDAEADDIRRRQAADDWSMARRDDVATDPVTGRLAALLGTTVARIDLLSGLTFAAVLEGVACLLWTVGLRSRPPAPDPALRPARINRRRASAPIGHEVLTNSRRPEAPPVSSVVGMRSADADVTRLAQDITAGLVRPTVADIRRHLSCSQARATALRRQVAAIRPAA